MSEVQEPVVSSETVSAEVADKRVEAVAEAAAAVEAAEAAGAAEAAEEAEDKTSEKKRVSFQLVEPIVVINFPDVNPIILWLNVENSKIELERYKLNAEFFEQDNINRDKIMRLSSNIQTHQYTDYVFFQEFDLKEQTPENIAIRFSLVKKKTFEQRCHCLFNVMTISEINISMCLLTMEQFEKIRRLYSNLFRELEKKYIKIQGSLTMSLSFDQMLEWKQNLEPITNYLQVLHTEIDKNSHMLTMYGNQYEQLKLGHVINKHNYSQALNYLDVYYPLV